MNKPVILIIEDDDFYQDEWPYYIGKDAEYLKASTIQEAQGFIDTCLSKVDLIIMDACMPGREINTDGLVRYIRSKGFAGPIIAASSDGILNQQLMRAGCSHDADGKQGVVDVARELLPAIRAEKVKADAQRPVGDALAQATGATPR